MFKSLSDVGISNKIRRHKLPRSLVETYIRGKEIECFRCLTYSASTPMCYDHGSEDLFFLLLLRPLNLPRTAPPTQPRQCYPDSQRGLLTALPCTYRALFHSHRFIRSTYLMPRSTLIVCTITP